MIKTILYVGSQYEYSKKENGESLNKRAFFNGFIKLGYVVTPIWYDDDHKNLQEQIINIAQETKPDIVFFILQENQIKVDTLKKLKKSGFFTVNWFGDDHWRFNLFTKHYANLFSACITTDKFSVEKYKLIGQNNIIRSEWASLDSIAEYKDVEYKYDVSFVGGENPFRRWFVDKLKSLGISVHCFGDRWENGRVTYEEMERIFSVTKVNLNISNTIQYDIRYLTASPRNIINTLRGGKNKSQVKARVFEVPAQGGFVLTEYVPCIEDYFDLGTEIVCYKDVDEAAILINYYLSNDYERERIKLAGVKKARKKHTYIHRIKHFMEDISEKKIAKNGS
tara:strand:- start:1769 stop:2779 length:1011 start_codon:yes stop_codon:yes gene_type:complete